MNKSPKLRTYSRLPVWSKLVKTEMEKSKPEMHEVVMLTSD